MQPRAPARGPARYGLMSGTSATTPASAKSRATSPTRRTFSVAVVGGEAEVAVEAVAQVVAVEQVGGHARASSSVARRATATVDLPEPDRPVNHTVAPCDAGRAQRSAA